MRREVRGARKVGKDWVLLFVKAVFVMGLTFIKEENRSRAGG